MTSSTHSKTARLEARVPAEAKALWQKAADLEGRTLTDFIIINVQQAACQVIEQHQLLQLSVEESEAFVDAILNPPEPNQALREAVLRYHQRI